MPKYLGRFTWDEKVNRQLLLFLEILICWHSIVLHISLLNNVSPSVTWCLFIWSVLSTMVRKLRYLYLFGTIMVILRVGSISKGFYHKASYLTIFCWDAKLYPSLLFIVCFQSFILLTMLPNDGSYCVELWWMFTLSLHLLYPFSAITNATCPQS